MLYVLDAGGGSYTVTFGSGLVFKDLYFQVYDAPSKTTEPRGYPYLPNPGDRIYITAEVENVGAVTESGTITVYLGGVPVGTVQVEDLAPFGIFTNTACTLGFTIPVSGYSVCDEFEVSVPGQASRLVVMVNTPATGDISLPVSPAVLTPAGFAAAALADPDGGVTTCYWDFGDINEPSDYFSFQAQGTQVTHTYTQSGTFTVRMRIEDSNYCMTEVSRQVTISETRPDLVVSSIASDPAEMTLPWTPQDVKFTITVTNQGLSATADSFLVGLYLDGTFLGTVTCAQTLDPGASATLDPFTVHLDSLNHVFTANADDTGLISEADENNNSRSLMLTTDYPDLTISDLSYELPCGRTTLSYGEMITASATVSNMASDTGLTFYVLFLLDGKAVASRAVDGLAGGEQKTVSFSFLATPGTHTVEAVADAELNRVVEMNEDNNSASVTLPEINVILPDLSILSLQASPNAGTVAAGSPLTLSALVSNFGAGDAAIPFAVSFYVDGVFAGSRTIDSLAAGASTLVSLNALATASTHQVKVVADEEGALPETDRGNNSATVSVGPFDILKSDLVITSLLLTPDYAAAGDTVTAHVTVKNIGDAATLASFDMLLTLDGGAVALLRSAGSLTPGSSADLTGTFSVCVSAGTHTIHAEADSAGLIDEKNESNNSADATLDTTGDYVPPAPVGFSLGLTAGQASYGYSDVITLQGVASDSTGVLSGLLVAVSFVAGQSIWTKYVETGVDGAWSLSIPVADVVKAMYLQEGLSGPLQDLMVTVSAQNAGMSQSEQTTITINGPDPAAPIIVLDPAQLSFGVRPGDLREMSLTILNVGNTVLNLSAVKGIALLPWMSLAVPTKTELAPGESITVNLYVAPPADMTLPHIFSGQLQVQVTYGSSDNQQTLTQLLPFTVELSNLDIASLKFNVNGVGQLPVVGAMVTILHLSSYFGHQAASNSEGSVSFNAIECGEYLYAVSAEGYQTAIGTIQTGNLQAGAAIDVGLIPDISQEPAIEQPTFTMTASASACYTYEPIIVTLAMDAGILAMTDVSAYLRVLDSNGEDVTSRFETIQLSHVPATLSDNESVNARFLLVPVGNTVGHYTLEGIESYSVDASPRTKSFTCGLEVRGPPQLAIAYFIPATLKIGSSCRAGFEITNSGSSVQDLRVDYFYLALADDNYLMPASYSLTQGSLTPPEGNLSIDLGPLENSASIRGYFNVASMSDCLLDHALLSVSIVSSFGVALPLWTTTIGTYFLFKDQIRLIDDPLNDASLVADSAASLPCAIYSWSDGGTIPVNNTVAQIDHEPTFSDPNLNFQITDESEGYVLVSIADSWAGYALLEAERGDGGKIDELNYWRGYGNIFLLDDADNEYRIKISTDFRVDNARPGYFAGNACVTTLTEAWMVVTWQELVPQIAQPDDKPWDIFWGIITFHQPPAVNSWTFYAYHVFGALVRLDQTPEDITIQSYIFQVDSGYRHGVKSLSFNNFIVSDQPAVAAGDDGSFLIAYSLFDSDSDPSNLLQIFICNPSKQWQNNVTLGRGFSTMVRDISVAWDAEEQCYDMAFLANPDKTVDRNDSLYFAWIDSIGRNSSWTRVVSGHDREPSSPSLTVIDNHDPKEVIDMTNEETSKPHVIIAWSEVNDGVCLNALDHDFNLIWTEPSDGTPACTLANDGTTPTISGSIWNTVMLSWVDSKGTIQARVLDISQFKPAGLDLDASAQNIVNNTYSVADHGAGPAITCYRNGYFAVVYSNSSGIYWSLYDYLGRIAVGSDGPASCLRADHQTTSGGYLPSVAGENWDKNLVVVWTARCGTTFAVYSTIIEDTVTSIPNPDWYPGDAHTHSAQSSLQSEDGTPLAYYSWFDPAYGFLGSEQYCLPSGLANLFMPNIVNATFKICGINIDSPHAPTPASQAAGAQLVGLDWIVLTEHEPMLGMPVNGNILTAFSTDLGESAVRQSIIDTNAIKSNSSRLFIAMSGLEQGTSIPKILESGHYLSYDLNDGNPNHDNYYPQMNWTINEERLFVQFVNQNGGFGVIAHPAGPSNGNPWMNWDGIINSTAVNPDDQIVMGDAESAIPGMNVVGMEVLTGRDHGAEADELCWDWLLSSGIKCFGYGNSDGHWSIADLIDPSYATVGTNRTFIYFNGDVKLTREDILGALRDGFITFSSGLDQLTDTLAWTTPDGATVQEGIGVSGYSPTDSLPLYSSDAINPRLEIHCTAPLKDLKLYYGLVLSDVHAMKPDRRVSQPIDLNPDGATDMTFYLDLNQLGYTPYIRLEGTTITGVKVYAEPFFIDSPMTLQSEQSQNITYAAGAGCYSQQFYIFNSSSTHLLGNVSVSATALVDLSGDSIPSSNIAIVLNTQTVAPLSQASFSVNVQLGRDVPDGQYTGTVTITAMDDKGNVQETVQHMIIVVSRAPLAPPTLTSADTGDGINPTSITVFGTALPGIVYEILVDGVVAACGNADESGAIAADLAMTRGSHLITARSKNANGDYSVESMPITVLNPWDIIPPALSYQEIGDPLPNEGWYSSDVTVVLDAVDEQGGSGLAGICYAIGNSDAVAQSVNWQEYSSPISITDSGVTYIAYWAIDKDGNISETRLIRVGIDKDAPVASITNPVNNGDYGGSVQIIGTATDSNPLSYYLDYIRGMSPDQAAQWTTIAVNSSWTDSSTIEATWDTSMLPRDVYTLRLVVRDQGGRQSQDMVTIVAGGLPTINSLEPALGDVMMAVTITGRGFGSLQGQSVVAFGSVNVVDYLSWSDSAIQVLVPVGAYGMTQVTLTTETGASNAWAFSVLPSITSISPSAVVPGDNVVITGCGFGPFQGSSTVSFGTTGVVNILSWSDAAIKVIVPQGFLGQVPMTVTTAGGTSNAVTLTLERRTILSIDQVSAVQYSDMGHITARLLDENGRPLAQEILVFTFEGAQTTITTDSQGSATWSSQINLSADDYEFLVSFLGNGDYLPSSAEATLTVIKANVTVYYTGYTKVRSGAPITLSVLLAEIPNSTPGNIQDAGNVLFDIYDEGRLVRVVTAPITTVSQGVASVTVTTAALPAGLYTVKAKTSDGSYYAQTQICSVDLVVYDPRAGWITGTGAITGGLKIISFRAKYNGPNDTTPSGYLLFTDLSLLKLPILITASQFSNLMVEQAEKDACASGACTFNGAAGFTFTLYVHDTDSKLIGSADWIHLVVQDLTHVVYDVLGILSVGNLAIKE